MFSGTSETLLRSVINRYKNRDQIKKNNLYTTTNLHMMHRPKGIDAAIEALGFVEYQGQVGKALQPLHARPSCRRLWDVRLQKPLLQHPGADYKLLWSGEFLVLARPQWFLVDAVI